VHEAVHIGPVELMMGQSLPEHVSLLVSIVSSTDLPCAATGRCVSESREWITSSNKHDGCDCK
jgi:hypothetical protein